MKTAAIILVLILSSSASFTQEEKRCSFTTDPCDHVHVDPGPVRSSAVIRAFDLLKYYNNNVEAENKAQGLFAIERAFLASLITFSELSCAYDQLNENERGAFFFMAGNDLPQKIHHKAPGAPADLHPEFTPEEDWRKKFEYFLDYSFEGVEYELTFLTPPEEQEEILRENHESLKRRGLTVCPSQ